MYTYIYIYICVDIHEHIEGQRELAVHLEVSRHICRYVFFKGDKCNASHGQCVICNSGAE